jgi:hypothetical protein
VKERWKNNKGDTILGKKARKNIGNHEKEIEQLKYTE